MNQRPKLLQSAAVAIAIACYGVAFAADQEKDASDKARKSTQSISNAPPLANIVKSDKAGPGTPDYVPMKDRKIVAPDGFSSKDRKIVAPDKPNGVTVTTDSPAPILAAPSTAPSAPAVTTAGK